MKRLLFYIIGLFVILSCNNKKESKANSRFILQQTSKDTCLTDMVKLTATGHKDTILPRNEAELLQRLWESQRGGGSWHSSINGTHYACTHASHMAHMSHASHISSNL